MKTSTLLRLSAALFAIVLSAASFAPASAAAAPTLRGFQIDLDTADEALVSELANTWKINLVRLQIGDNARMDGTTGAEYIQMMENRFAVLDQKLPLFAAHNIKVVFALYSPPGGFQTRTAPSHYQMFSQKALQQEFLDMWVRIMNRYKDNTTIYAFDLLNEPALRSSLFGGGAKTWNGLVVDTIKAVRAIAPNSKLMIKSLYGDPTKLTSLPALKFPNLVYSYHAYPFQPYQHSGINSGAFSINRPAPKAVQQKLLGLLAKFYLKQKQRKLKKQVLEFPPKLNVGEAAISACAKESAPFLDSLLAVIEKGSAAKLSSRRVLAKASRLKGKPASPAQAFFKYIKHDSYTVHSFNEAEVWDPRTSCSQSGALSRASSTTDRGVALQSYFSKNK